MFRKAGELISQTSVTFSVANWRDLLSTNRTNHAFRLRKGLLQIQCQFSAESGHETTSGIYNTYRIEWGVKRRHSSHGVSHRVSPGPHPGQQPWCVAVNGGIELRPRQRRKTRKHRKHIRFIWNHHDQNFYHRFLTALRHLSGSKSANGRHSTLGAAHPEALPQSQSKESTQASWPNGMFFLLFPVLSSILIFIIDIPKQPENGPLEEEIPFGNHHFQVPC